MTIKQRIFFSNIVMFLFLLFYAVGILFFSFNSLTKAYESYSGGTNGAEDNKVISGFEVQTLTEKFAEFARKTEGNMTSSRESGKFISDLEETGTIMMVTVDDEIKYLSEGYKYDTLMYEAEKFIGSVTDGNITCMKDNGYVYVERAELEPGKEYGLVMVNNRVSISETTGRRSDYIVNLIDTLKNNIQSYTFVGAVAIIIINLALVTLVANSIMKPLDLLKEGAQNIFNGDLDFTLEYDREDEISEVLESFEQMRRQLRESQDEQKKYEENRKRLIAGISHDLRTPLTAIKGYVSGLRDGIADTEEKREMYLNTIYSTADDMDRLVDDLFLFSRLDLDKLPFSFEEIDIVEFMSMCCEEIKFSLEKKNVLLTYKDFCGMPVYVRLDRNKFARVLLNIADNSAKYKKGELGNLYVTTGKKDGYVEIRLKDDGIGVSKESLPKLFESFYRSDSARTNPVKGSGLGLAIAKQIVEAHKGTIRAENNLGEGLTIVIDIPFAGRSSAAAEE